MRLATPLPADFEEYHIVRPLGRGAMGEVFLAHDTALDRAVAIKLASGGAKEGVREGSSRERLFAEARALARVRHENVIAIHRVGEVRGRPYLVSEHVAGESLDSVVGPVEETALLRIARGLASALAAVHRAGLLHRDIKPANAVLGPDGVVKLIDFGLAEAMSGEGEPAGRSDVPPPRLACRGVDPTISLQVTQIVEPSSAVGRSPRDLWAEGAGAPSARRYRMAGTPLYMAPEMWAGGRASAQTDIYALGATLYRLAAGEAPFSRVPSERLCAAKLGSEADPVSRAAPRLSPWLAAVIERAIARSPEERYPSAEALLAALESESKSRRAAPRGVRSLTIRRKSASMLSGRGCPCDGVSA